jgi:ADP-heptose:LPS heptosyltransferase
VVERLIDEVITDGVTGAGALDWLPWVKPFGGRTFDLVIDTQENLRRSAVAKRAGRRVVSAAGRGADWPEAVVDRLGVLLAEAAPGAKLQPLRLTNPRALEAANALLPLGEIYVGFAPGAGGQEKRWPLASYVALAKLQETKGRKPVFFFGPDEAEDEATVRAAMPNALFPESCQTGIKGPLLVIALASRLAAAVANDAGPGHMLAAGGAPLLSLQKDRRKAAKFRPAAQRLEVLVAEDYGGGMDALPVDSAAQALERLLA